MRIYTTVTKGEMLLSFIKLSQLILSEMYEDQSRELFCVCLLGLRINAPFHMISDRILQPWKRVWCLFNLFLYTFFSISASLVFKHSQLISFDAMAQKQYCLGKRETVVPDC